PSAEETQNPLHFRRIKDFLPLAEQEEATEVLEVEDDSCSNPPGGSVGKPIACQDRDVVYEVDCSMPDENGMVCSHKRRQGA
ncbi:unnamed protein product, partial [Ectocarpus fasciculatus]